MLFSLSYHEVQICEAVAVFHLAKTLLCHPLSLHLRHASNRLELLCMHGEHLTMPALAGFLFAVICHLPCRSDASYYSRLAMNILQTACVCIPAIHKFWAASYITCYSPGWLSPIFLS